MTKQPCISVRPPESFHAPYEFGPWILTDSKMSYDYEDGDLLQVEVYSVGDKIELYQNDQLVDTKTNHEVRPNFTTFDVIYKEGSLMAISYKNNKEIARTVLKSSKEVDHIHTNVYTYDLLAFIEIELHDQDHIIVSNANGKLRVDGNILALSSVDTHYNKGFKYKEVDIKDGVALVICEKEDICIHFNSLEKTIHFEK